VLDPGVVDQDVQLAQVLLNVRDTPRDGFLVRDVEGHGLDPVLAETLGEHFACPFQAVRVKAVQHHTCSGGGQAVRQRLSDAPRGAGYQGTTPR
jgi:hypothetical protein